MLHSKLALGLAVSLLVIILFVEQEVTAAPDPCFWFGHHHRHKHRHEENKDDDKKDDKKENKKDDKKDDKEKEAKKEKREKDLKKVMDDLAALAADE